MSPIIHKSVTWSIVGTVVFMSSWLADNIQDARSGQPLRGPAAVQAPLPSPALLKSPVQAQAQSVAPTLR